MIVLIDAGNTNIVFALSDGKKILHSWRCKTDAARTADEYVSMLHPLFVKEGYDFASVSDVVLSSVVPDANFNLMNLARRAFSCEPLIVSPDTADLKINLPNASQLGADRIADAVAVIADYSAPAIVVDFGTATTFEVINSKNEYCGGAIAPGINLSVAALHMAAAKLPRVEIRKPPKVIATDTVTAIQAGIYWGYVGLIEGILTRTIAEMKEKPVVIATGGLAKLFAADIPAIQKVDDDLTLRGILYVYQSRKKKES